MRFNSQLFVRVVILVLLMVTSSVAMTVAAEQTLDSPEDTVSLPEYILSCYDPASHGFGARPGESATFETTLTAVWVLEEEGAAESWPTGLHMAIDGIVGHYAAMERFSTGTALHCQPPPAAPAQELK